MAIKIVLNETVSPKPKRVKIKQGIRYKLINSKNEDVGSVGILPDGYWITIIVDKNTGKTKDRYNMSLEDLIQWADKYNIGWVPWQ